MKKKYFHIFIVFFLISTFLIASEYSDLLDKSKTEYEEGNYEEAKKTLKSAQKILENEIARKNSEELEDRCGYCGKACDPSLGNFPNLDKYVVKSISRFEGMFKVDRSDYTCIKNVTLSSMWDEKMWFFRDTEGNTIRVWVEDHHCKEYVMDKYEKNKKTTFTLYGVPYKHISYGNVLDIDRIE